MADVPAGGLCHRSPRLYHFRPVLRTVFPHFSSPVGAVWPHWKYLSSYGGFDLKPLTTDIFSMIVVAQRTKSKVD